MSDLHDFDRNVRANGILIDTNLLVLLIVYFVNRDRIARFKRTTGYSAADWDLLKRHIGADLAPIYAPPRSCGSQRTYGHERSGTGNRKNSFA